jgi:hypothetical protein
MGFVMGKAIVYWSLGLLSVGWLSGCCCLRNPRAEACDDKDTPRVRKLDSAGAAPGLIDTSGSAKATSQEKRGPLGPVKTNAPDMPPNSAIAPPDRFLRESQNLPGPPPLYGDYPDLERKSAVKTIEPKRAETIPGVAPRPQVVEFPAPGKLGSESPPATQKTTTTPNAQNANSAADKFKVVTGQVTLYRKAWRLRYADITQEDPYGGVLVLDVGPELSELRDGQRVRVRGTLVPPVDRNGPAHYRVTAIEMLD